MEFKIKGILVGESRLTTQQEESLVDLVSKVKEIVNSNDGTRTIVVVIVKDYKKENLDCIPFLDNTFFNSMGETLKKTQDRPQSFLIHPKVSIYFETPSTEQDLSEFLDKEEFNGIGYCRLV